MKRFLNITRRRVPIIESQRVVFNPDTLEVKPKYGIGNCMRGLHIIYRPPGNDLTASVRVFAEPNNWDFD